MLSKKAKRQRNAARRAVLEAEQITATYKATWLSDPRPSCPVCSEPRSTVATRYDPLMAELDPDSQQELVSCLPCWWDRSDEV